MKIGLLIKQVPLKMKTGADGLMDRSGNSQINPYCKHALEEAIKFKSHFSDGHITVISMGPPNFQQSIHEAISMGADAGILLSDRMLAGSDTYATAKALAKLLEVHGTKFDIIFAGLQTVDGDTAHVPSQVAERMGYNQATYVEHIEPIENGVKVRRLIERGYQYLSIPYPAMISITNTANIPRGPYLKGLMLAKHAKAKIYNVTEHLGYEADEVGLAGSPTVVAKVKKVISTRVLKKIIGTTEEQVQEFFQLKINRDETEST